MRGVMSNRVGQKVFKWFGYVERRSEERMVENVLLKQSLHEVIGRNQKDLIDGMNV